MQKRVIALGILMLFIACFTPAIAATKYSGWQNVYVKGVCSFQIPSTMEMQAGKYKANIDKMARTYNFPRDAKQVVAQQKGLNKFEKQAFNRYCRVMVSYEDSNEYTGYRLGDSLSFSREDLSYIRKSICDPLSKVYTIYEFSPVEICRAKNFDYLHCYYIRKGFDGAPPVKVHMNIVFNGYRTHSVIVSYRKKEASIWQRDLESVINTFDFVRK